MSERPDTRLKPRDTSTRLQVQGHHCSWREYVSTFSWNTAALGHDVRGETRTFGVEPDLDAVTVAGEREGIHRQRRRTLEGLSVQRIARGLITKNAFATLVCL